MEHFIPKFSEIPGISEMDGKISEVCDWSIISWRTAGVEHNDIGETLTNGQKSNKFVNVSPIILSYFTSISETNLHFASGSLRIK